MQQASDYLRLTQLRKLLDLWPITIIGLGVVVDLTLIVLAIWGFGWLVGLL